MSLSRYREIYVSITQLLPTWSCWAMAFPLPRVLTAAPTPIATACVNVDWQKEIRGSLFQFKRFAAFNAMHAPNRRSTLKPRNESSQPGRQISSQSIQSIPVKSSSLDPTSQHLYPSQRQQKIISPTPQSNPSVKRLHHRILQARIDISRTLTFS